MSDGKKVRYPVLVGSRVVYQGRILSLRIDSLDMGDGAEGHFEVVEHAGSVTILAFADDGRLLLVRQHRQPAGRELLELPAGCLDEGESPEACAERELREETGLRPARLERLGGFFLAPGYTTEYMHAFLASGLTHAPLEPDADEHIEVRAVTLDELHGMIAAGEIDDAKTLAALLLYERRRSTVDPSPTART